MAPLRSPWRYCGSSLHFNLPSLLPPHLRRRGLEICFSSAALPAHTHAHTHLDSALLQTLGKKREHHILHPWRVKMRHSRDGGRCHIGVRILHYLILGQFSAADPADRMSAGCFISCPCAVKGSFFLNSRHIY